MTPSWAKLREQVIDRDGTKCYLCSVQTVRYRGKQARGWVGPANQLTIDHIIPSSLGGLDDLDNLAVCCRGCNDAKDDVLPLRVGRNAKPQHIDRRRQLAWLLTRWALAMPMGRKWL